jgi:hypothetical protein
MSNKFLVQEEEVQMEALVLEQMRKGLLRMVLRKQWIYKIRNLVVSV